MRMLRTRTITRIRVTPGGRDPDGDPIPSTETATAVPGCLVAPRYGPTTGEMGDLGRYGVVVGLTAYIPAGVSVGHKDLFEIDGARYRITGEPGVWSGHRTGGIEVALERSEG